MKTAKSMSLEIERRGSFHCVLKDGAWPGKILVPERHEME